MTKPNVDHLADKMITPAEANTDRVRQDFQQRIHDILTRACDLAEDVDTIGEGVQLILELAQALGPEGKGADLLLTGIEHRYAAKGWNIITLQSGSPPLTRWVPNYGEELTH